MAKNVITLLAQTPSKDSPLVSLVKAPAGWQVSNLYMTARYNFSPFEQKVMYHIMLCFHEKRKILTTQDLFGKNLDVFIPIDELRRIDPDAAHNLSQAYYSATKRLAGKEIIIEPVGEDKWEAVSFIIRRKFDIKEGLLVTVSQLALPFLRHLEKGYTYMNTLTAFSIKSKYTQRFYQWCCQFKAPMKGKKFAKFSFTPDELNEALQTSYKPNDLYRTVISVAEKELYQLHKEIPQKSDLYFAVETEREGRGGGIKKWNFLILSNEQKKEEQPETTAQMNDVLIFLKMCYQDKATKYAQKYFNELIDRDKLNVFAWRIEGIKKDIKDGKVRNLGAYVRTVMEKEYQIFVFPKKAEMNHKNLSKNWPDLMPDVSIPSQMVLNLTLNAPVLNTNTNE